MQGGFWSGLGWVRRLFEGHDSEIGVHLAEAMDSTGMVWGTEMNTQTGEVRRVLGPAFRPRAAEGLEHWDPIRGPQYPHLPY